MISSSAVPNFSWSAAAPLNALPAGVAQSALNASAESFQNIFANTAALPQFAASSPALAAGSLGSNLAANWSPQASGDADADDDSSAAPASNSDSDSQPASAADSNSPPASWPSGNPACSGSSTLLNSSSEPSGAQTSSEPAVEPDSRARSTNAIPAKAANQATARNEQASAKAAGAKAGKKTDAPSQAQPAATNGGALPGAPAGAAAGSAASHRAAQAAADRGAAVQQTEGASDSTAKTPSSANALPGSANLLSGAAFALHITPANHHSAAAQKTAAASGGAAQEPAASAPTATPAGNPLSDPVGAVAAANAGQAGVPVSATLIASSGTAGARELSAVGASSNSTGAAPWSMPTSSPALLDDKAEAAESAAPAAPAAEIDMEDPTGAAQPVRALQLQLGGTGDQRVDLRLIEHAGGLSVSVRASDSSLTRGLQENLPELSSRLAAEHYQTQTWLPAAGQTSAGGHASGSPEQSPDQRGGKQSSGDGSSSGGQGHAQQQDRQRDQAPAWWRQLAALGGAPAAAATSVSGSLPDAAAIPISQQ